MSKVILNDTTMTAIGNAIREKTGSTGLLLPSEMVTAIQSITTGTGSGSGFSLDDIKYYEYNSTASDYYYDVPSDFTVDSTILIWLSGYIPNGGTTNYGILGGVLVTALANRAWAKDQPSSVRAGYRTVSGSSSLAGLVESVGLGITNFNNVGLRVPAFFRRNGLDWSAGSRKIVKVQLNNSNGTIENLNGKGGIRMLYIP